MLGLHIYVSVNMGKSCFPESLSLEEPFRGKYTLVTPRWTGAAYCANCARRWRIKYTHIMNIPRLTSTVHSVGTSLHGDVALLRLFGQRVSFWQDVMANDFTQKC
jgi:hypothetical protein